MDIPSLLYDRGLATQDQISAARLEGAGKRIDQVLVSQGVVSEEAVLKAFAEELHMRFVPLKDFKVDPNALSMFPATAVFRHGVLPLERVNGHVTVATSDPFDFEALDELGSLAR